MISLNGIVGRFSFGCVLAASLLVSAQTLAAQSVTGVVTNKTDGKVAAGDEVVLLKLAQGMQELSTTKTDGKGHFVLKVPAEEAGAMHLVRVKHDGANYFAPLPPGAIPL